MKQIINDYQKLISVIIKNKLGYENKDLEQEVLLKAWQNLNKYDKTKGTLKTWLLTITKNILIDYYRSKSYKYLIDNIEDSTDLLETIPSLELSPDELIDQKKRQIIVFKALQSLPKKLRDIVVLYEYEELTYEEIAKKLNLPIGTVKSRLSNARLILKKLLTPLIKGE